MSSVRGDCLVRDASFDDSDRQPAMPRRPQGHRRGRDAENGCGGPRPVESGCHCKGRCRHGEYRRHRRHRRPPTRPYELIAGSVIFNRHDQTRGAERAACHFQVPAIPIAAPPHGGSDRAQRLLHTSEPRVGRLPSLGPAREGPRPREGRPNPAGRWARSCLQPAAQTRNGMEHVEQRREKAQRESSEPGLTTAERRRSSKNSPRKCQR